MSICANDVFQECFENFLLFIAVSEAHKLLLDEDKLKRVHEILEEAGAMVKATVSSEFHVISNYQLQMNIYMKCNLKKILGQTGAI